MSRTSNKLTDERAEGADLTASERHRLLADDRRRAALACLASRTEPVDLADLTLAVTKRETEASPVPEDRLERVAVSLHHNHLPQMSDLGVLDYDAESGEVETLRTDPDALVR
jgi:hypothetical protein